MTDYSISEPMLEMYIFETSQQLELLEQMMMNCEKSNKLTPDEINEIFRIMHTIKGSSAMMLFNSIGSLAHSIEDLFYYIREQKLKDLDYSGLTDLILEGVDFIKVEIIKIKSGDNPDGESKLLIDSINAFLSEIKAGFPSGAVVTKPEPEKKQQYYIATDKKVVAATKNWYKANVMFQENCEMENIRGYTIIHNLKEIAQEVFFLPADIIENEETCQIIREQGFDIYMISEQSYEEINAFFMKVSFLKELQLIQLDNDDEFKQFYEIKPTVVQPILVPQITPAVEKHAPAEGTATSQSIISVNVEKLDKLMDLVGEMVIAEAMVTQNPELKALGIESFQKSGRQLHKITGELQDTVMAIRMVPLSTTFMKMQRILRDMCKKLNKEARLVLIGEETEVDKNIIDSIADPLMHCIRNSLDHGIEDANDRLAKGKDKVGQVTLEAKNSGSDVLVLIKDDGKGLKKSSIYAKAKKNGFVDRLESEMTDQEIYNLILLPGFSTKDTVTEFSGRGVGMDVVVKNLESIGGSVVVDSIEDAGTSITFKIPLTLAIIDGMNIKVGNSRFTVPIIAIRESFRPKKADVLVEPSGAEMIMVRGQCYPILRLHKHYFIDTKIQDFTEGILIMVEHDGKTCCLFADELLGQQQVVVKALPNYIKKKRKINGLGGCTLLGDGSISLILDISGLITTGDIS